MAATQIKERILLTAHDLFYKEGIRATGVDQIIAQSEVAKRTFYRYFPSKNELIVSYLEYRHQLWIDWFRETTKHYKTTKNQGSKALLQTLEEWFSKDDFRGCAFINALAEVGETIPEVTQITARHKEEMTLLIQEILPETAKKKENAQIVALAIDGAIVNAQYTKKPKESIHALGILLDILEHAD